MALITDKIMSKIALAPVSIIAGGTGDNVAQNGETLERVDYDSLVVAVPVTTTLTANKTLTLSAKLQQSTDGSNWADVAGLTAQKVINGGETGGTFKDCLELNAYLRPLKKYVRAVITGDLSNTSADTASFAAVYILGDRNTEPV